MISRIKIFLESYTGLIQRIDDTLGSDTVSIHILGYIDISSIVIYQCIAIKVYIVHYGCKFYSYLLLKVQLIQLTVSYNISLYHDTQVAIYQYIQNVYHASLITHIIQRTII